jgi:hypothetical protein
LAPGDDDAGLELAALLARLAVGEEAARLRRDLKAARKFLRRLDLELSPLAERAQGEPGLGSEIARVELQVAQVRAWVEGLEERQADLAELLDRLQRLRG